MAKSSPSGLMREHERLSSRGPDAFRPDSHVLPRRRLIRTAKRLVAGARALARPSAPARHGTEGTKTIPDHAAARVIHFAET